MRLAHDRITDNHRGVGTEHRPHIAGVKPPAPCPCLLQRQPPDECLGSLTGQRAFIDLDLQQFESDPDLLKQFLAPG